MYIPPNPNYTGPDMIVVEICDAGSPAPMICRFDTIFVTVVPVNDKPVAMNDMVSIPENTTATIPVLNNDTDIDSDLDPSSVVIITPPNNGTATPDPLTGIITYIPDPNFFGADTIAYSVCDQGSPTLCDTAVVFISVNATNVRLALKMRLQGALYNTAGHPDARCLAHQQPDTGN